MTTTLRIVHTTGYRYSATVSDSFTEIRMSPQYGEDQLIRERIVAITPYPWSYGYIDYWGTQVTAFELHEPHDSMTVRIDTSLDVTRTDPAPSTMTLAEVRDAADRWNEYLVQSPMVQPGDDLARRAEEIAARSATVDECAMEIGRLIHGHMEYLPGSTDVTSHAEESWAARKGVCQDFAHLMIGALRHVQVPARYVSGYVMPRADTEIGETVIGESHAWAQWWDGEWSSFDPTNDIRPSEVHVQVGVGREYGDVAPLRGMFTGSAEVEMFVEVEMTRLR